jgi:uncharacterized protein (DUF362 family)
MKMNHTRREFLGAMGLAAGAYMTQPSSLLAQPAPASSVAIGSCPEYNRQVIDVLSTMFDQLGGLETLVRGKTVAIKLNMTGLPTERLQYLPAEMTHWVHPQVIWGVMFLLDKAGAQRIRLLESAWSTSEPLEEFMIGSGWQPNQFRNAARRVEFENTNFLGNAKSYSRLMVPKGGLMCRGYDLNHSYEDCDVFLSLAKLKRHRTTGVTLSIKNCFGIIPCTIYGDNVPEDQPAITPVGGRGPFHTGSRIPPKSAPPLVNVNAPKDGGYRVPRAAADLVAARPVHLAVIDGIYSMVGGELPDQPGLHAAIHPGLLIAGKNCVCTDAVGTAVMGFDPSADRGTPPFKTSDNMLRLAEQLGVGTRDLKRIEVIGTPASKARFLYSQTLAHPEQVTHRA